jgi:quercetin dioxygenase-like cupin family protein
VQIVRGRAPESTPTQNRTETFTGTVWGDPVLPTTEGARTYWHHHTGGQILVVTAGLGWVCPHGEKPQVIRAGDVVWVPPGERHWHGGTVDTVLTHLAISIGRTTWLDEVSDEDYRAASGEATQ